MVRLEVRLRHRGGLQWQGNDTSLKRSSRSCGRSLENSRLRKAVSDLTLDKRQYGRYGYRKIPELLRQAGWTINDKRVERIWQREGLKVPHKQPKR